MVNLFMQRKVPRSNVVFHLSYYRARTTVPVCSNLQAQILSCYRGNKDRSLQCADLAKAYMQCIDAAKKVGALLYFEFHFTSINYLQDFQLESICYGRKEAYLKMYTRIHFFRPSATAFTPKTAAELNYCRISILYGPLMKQGFRQVYVIRTEFDRQLLKFSLEKKVSIGAHFLM